MPKDDWLLFLLSVPFLLVSMKMECPDGPVLVALSD